jgi:uncharacterized membrane protein YozB (DUF420 family)
MTRSKGPALDLSFLPAINATLNGVAGLLLVVGRMLIKRGRERAHRTVMLSAFGVSSLFLVLYLAHKASRGFENTTFNAVGAAKTAYLALLFTHLTLAMAVPVMAILLLRYALRDERASHRRLARIAWPVWMYVSVTGVLIYFLLYQFNPAA